MHHLFDQGQHPETMVVSCCDARVDPAVILQCDPGDLFVVRNIANIVPPYIKDNSYYGTNAALEFGVCFLKIKHLILLGHSKCGGIQALLNHETAKKNLPRNDFITNWVSLIKVPNADLHDPDSYAKLALQRSYSNCQTFPWIKDKVASKELQIHLWFFDIKTGEISTYLKNDKTYRPLDYNQSN